MPLCRAAKRRKGGEGGRVGGWKKSPSPPPARSGEPSRQPVRPLFLLPAVEKLDETAELSPSPPHLLDCYSGTTRLDLAQTYPLSSPSPPSPLAMTNRARISSGPRFVSHSGNLSFTPDRRIRNRGLLRNVISKVMCARYYESGGLSQNFF